MTQSTSNNNNNSDILEVFDVFTPAIKSGEWVLPITVNGVTVYALQINKSAEDKKNIKDIVKDYINAGIELYTYAGKNGNPVILVEATKKIKATRSSVATDTLIAEFVKMGLTEEQARQAYANAKQASKK